MNRCGNIHPVDQDELQQHPNPADPKTIEKLFPTFEPGDRKTLAVSLAAGALFGLGLLYFRKVPQGARVEIFIAVSGLAAGALICAIWEPIAQFLTTYGDGEPLAILDGVRVWPTVLLRVFAIILSCYFIWRTLHNLHENLVEITGSMDLDPKPESFWAQIKSGFKTALFDFSLGTDRDIERSTESPTLSVKAVWEAYIGQERLLPRISRAAIYATGMFLFAMFVLVPMFGRPTNFARGDLAITWYKGTVFADVLLMQFLTFLVFDATLICLLFVNKLRRAQSQWPQATTGVYKGRLQLQTNLIHDWIDLDFVAKRTNCIGSLIYFPFVLIALLIVSRSTVFANYAPSPHRAGDQSFCCFQLRHHAVLGGKGRAGHRQAQSDEGIIRAKDAKSNPRLAEQLETFLTRVAQLNEGAFSPLSQQPLVKALLFPLSSAGWMALIENGVLLAFSRGASGLKFALTAAELTTL